MKWKLRCLMEAIYSSLRDLQKLVAQEREWGQAWDLHYPLCRFAQLVHSRSHNLQQHVAACRQWVRAW